MIPRAEGARYIPPGTSPRLTLHRVSDVTGAVRGPHAPVSGHAVKGGGGCPDADVGVALHEFGINQAEVVFAGSTGNIADLA